MNFDLRGEIRFRRLASNAVFTEFRCFLGVYSDASVKGWTGDCVKPMVNVYLHDLMRRQRNIQGLAL